MTMELPFERCPSEGCGRKLLTKPPIKCELLTLTYGKVPILCPSLYCKGQQKRSQNLTSLRKFHVVCKIRFYHNFQVARASEKEATRCYYSAERPEFMEIQDHIFADREFCEWVRMEIAINKSDISSPKFFCS